MTPETLRILQDGYDEISHRAGLGPDREQRIEDALKILLSGHNVTPDEFSRALYQQISTSYPHSIILRFRTPEDKDQFVGQLSDGWGESHCDLVWPYEAGIDLANSSMIGVDLSDEEE